MNLCQTVINNDNGGSESSIDEENENDYIDSSDRDESSDHSRIHQ